MRWIFTTITVWLLFVLSLSTWWMIFGVTTLDQLANGQIGEGSKILRQQKMLFYEGSFLAIMQVLGGLGLFYFAFRMYQEKAATEKFFAAFAHDLKTSLFRLQLHVESLDGASPGADQGLLLAKTRHLQLNIENGLNSVVGGRKGLFMEVVDLCDFVADLHAQWPEMEIQLKGEQNLYCDKGALRSIFENLMHNSYAHGAASVIVVKVQKSSKENLELSYSDNGKVFDRSVDSLGQKPVNSEKGSGFGLYLVRFWVEKMKGKVSFAKSASGQLQVTIQLPVQRTEAS